MLPLSIKNNLTPMRVYAHGKSCLFRSGAFFFFLHFPSSPPSCQWICQRIKCGTGTLGILFEAAAVVCADVPLLLQSYSQQLRPSIEVPPSMSNTHWLGLRKSQYGFCCLFSGVRNMPVSLCIIGSIVFVLLLQGILSAAVIKWTCTTLQAYFKC